MSACSLKLTSQLSYRGAEREASNRATLQQRPRFYSQLNGKHKRSGTDRVHDRVVVSSVDRGISGFTYRLFYHLLD